SRYRPVVWTGERRMKSKSVTPRYALQVRQVFASTDRIERLGINQRTCMAALRKAPGVVRSRRIKTPSLSIGRGLRGGRWPGPMVERDDLRCYFGRGWVTDGRKIAGRQRQTKAGSPPPGFLTIKRTRPGRGWFMPVHQFF